MKIFLDDVRDPSNCLGYMHRRIGKDNLLYQEGWLTVRNYDDFVSAITKHINEVTHVSFDHYLAYGHYTEEVDYNLQEKTGYHAAKWMRDYYLQHNKELPTMFVHSMNIVGMENIINV